MAGLIFMSFCTLVAIFGFLIIPDHTPDVNTMYPDIAKKKPGFSCQYLQLKKPSLANEPSLLNKIINGWDNDCELVPIDTFWKSNDSIYFLPYGNTLEIGLPMGMLINKKSFVTKRVNILGVDGFGRDLFSRIIIGTRVSIAVGLVAVFISVLVGLLMGLLAGYYRGKVDGLIMWLINIIWSLPTLMFIIALTMAIGKGFWQIFVAVGLTSWVELARIVRGQVFSIREMEYIQAAQILGFNDIRIIIKHILPNIWGTVIIMSVANFASAILLEAGLSFLGQGLQPPSPSLGQMIKENYGSIIFDSAHLAIFPGLAIFITVTMFNLLGEGLTDAMDPRLKQ